MNRIICGIILVIIFSLSACQKSETIQEATPTLTGAGDSPVSTITLQKESATPMKTQRPPMVVIAHRGARSLAPENTLLAAQKAYDLGADMWELDVALTYDKQLVVLHDDTLNRTSNVAEVFPDRQPWSVNTFTLAELKTLDFGSWFVKTDPFDTIRDGVVSVEDQAQMKGTTIPTLEEALTLTKELGWRVNIEIKDLWRTPDGDAAVVRQVVALVEQMELVDSVIISSFRHEYLTRVKALNPNIVTAALVEEGVDDPVALVQSLGAQAYNPGISRMGEYKKIREVRDAGYDVYIYTVNDPVIYKRLDEAGVTGIFTDFPQRLLQYLKEKETP